MRLRKKTTWVFCRPKERYQRDKVQPFKKGKDITIMIWGAVQGMNKSSIDTMVRDDKLQKKGFTAKSYLSILQRQMEDLYAPGLLFMHDNASVHKAQVVSAWLCESDVVVLDWPAYSPNLNPIEHAWAKLKEVLNNRHPELVGMRTSKEAREAFLAGIREAWDSLDDDFILNGVACESCC